MATKKRKQQSINWNLIMFIIALAALSATIIPFINEKRTDSLKDEIEKLKSENEKLADQTDPAWYIKFNDQRDYFESELLSKNKIIDRGNEVIDSFRKLPITKLDSNYIVISVTAARNILIDLAKGERDSVLLHLYSEHISILDKQISNSDSIIFYQNKMLKSSLAIEQLQSEMIENYKKLYSNSEMIMPNYYVMGGLLILLILLAYLISRNYIKNRGA